MIVAAIDVDVQNTFTPVCPDELPVPEGDLIAAELNAQAALADYRIMTKDAHSAHAVWVTDSHQTMLRPLPYANADLTWVRHAEPGTQGFELITGLPHPSEYDLLIYKGVERDLHPYGACYHDIAETISTGLIEWLKVKQVDTVIVGGLALDYCVKTTALQLANAGFNTVVNLQASRGLTEQTIITAKQQMQQAGIILFDDLRALQDALSPQYA